MEKMVRFEEVNKHYGSEENIFYALKDVNFEIIKGEYVIILGPSGAGKSTLLNLLGGMDGASGGSVHVNDTDITKYNDQQLSDYRAENIGFVFQFYNLIPSLTALENIEITKDIRKQSLDAKSVLASVQLEEHADQFPSQLSGGEQQRVSIARAISKNPLMLLCDEPTGALDSKTGIEILNLLYKLCKVDKKTVVIVTHNAVLAPTADRVIHLKNGEIEKVVLNENPISIDEVSW